MVFRSRNAYYLRISTKLVLPLFLYLDERHIDWMSDVTLQRVLADLRPVVIPKFQAERDVHFGPGAAPGTKRGTVEVRRGDTYQFAYFFRKTEPHTVLLKSRYFVTVPVSKYTSPLEPANQGPRLKSLEPVKQSKRKRTKSKGKAQKYFDEDEWSTGWGEEDADVLSTGPHHVRKQRRVFIDTEESSDDVLQEIPMRSPSPKTGVRFPRDSVASVVEPEDAVSWNANNRASSSSDTADIKLVVEEEEKKPKPLLKLKHQSFSISGHCLCVVVEPWPSRHPETRIRSEDLQTTSLRGGLGSRSLNEHAVLGQRAETPLFLPEDDRALSEPSFARERTIPLFRDPARMEDREYDLLSFSQALNAAGDMHAITADDDDDMDGAILFGDADEVRELA